MTNDPRPHYAIRVENLPPTAVTCKCRKRFTQGDVLLEMKKHMDENNPKPTDPGDPKFSAAVDLLRRTGASEFQIRYCEENKPIIWMAVVRWKKFWQVAAALTPVEATFRLCDLVMDGGLCNHCGKPTGFSPDLDPLPAADKICWYQYDPELETFRRGCE